MSVAIPRIKYSRSPSASTRCTASRRLAPAFRNAPVVDGEPAGRASRCENAESRDDRLRRRGQIELVAALGRAHVAEREGVAAVGDELGGRADYEPAPGVLVPAATRRNRGHRAHSPRTAATATVRPAATTTTTSGLSSSAAYASPTRVRIDRSQPSKRTILAHAVHRISGWPTTPTTRRQRPVELILGPLLRYAGTESATVWVETSGACEVEVLGHRADTFAVEEHHYALVLVESLTPARSSRTRCDSTAALSGPRTTDDPGPQFVHAPGSVRSG